MYLHMQDGPVHDVQWHPSGEYFITVAGFMPAKSTLFTDTCKAHYDLGSGPHNIARWSPQVLLKWRTTRQLDAWKLC